MRSCGFRLKVVDSDFDGECDSMKKYCVSTSEEPRVTHWYHWDLFDIGIRFSLLKNILIENFRSFFQVTSIESAEAGANLVNTQLQAGFNVACARSWCLPESPFPLAIFLFSIFASDFDLPFPMQYQQYTCSRDFAFGPPLCDGSYVLEFEMDRIKNYYDIMVKYW